MDADILLQIRARVAVPVRFSFHGNQFLDQSRKRLFRQITALIGNGARFLILLLLVLVLILAQ